jgi:2,4-dienoyl-CoA reductase-like NADH-dependent reductase (Old Yellow Enzyme family)
MTLFEPFAINGVEFRNRALRSSIGGRTSFYDGTISPAFTSFETRFARGGVGGIISATISVNERRMSPLEYPALHHDRYVAPLREVARAVQAEGSRYIIQIGDPGGHTHTGLFAEDMDGKSASSYFDFFYGYRSKTTAMTQDEVEAAIEGFASAAERVKKTGSDGVEITASKGYLIHQFLNPATNRRDDAFGGSVDKRFHFLERIIKAARERVGRGYLLGVRLSAQDYNYLPVNLRFPIVFPLRHHFMGNTLKETLHYGKKLEALGVDYLHIDSGFGFPNPHGSPGSYPEAGVRLFVNATRHLSAKASIRAILINLTPAFLARAIFGAGWRFRPGANAEFAAAFKKAVRVPIIANGGFQARSVIEAALGGKCDMIAIARPLLANPDLLKQFQGGYDLPANPCSFCSECCARTAVLPLGCYDIRRFGSQEEMAEQIAAMSSPCRAHDLKKAKDALQVE